MTVICVSVVSLDFARDWSRRGVRDDDEDPVTTNLSQSPRQMLDIS